jgi:hypothetical protein
MGAVAYSTLPPVTHHDDTEVHERHVLYLLRCFRLHTK